MRSKLALCILVAMFCAQAPPPDFAASDLYIPFFTTSGAGPNEGICDVFKRSSINGTRTAGNPLFFLIDSRPAPAFTVKNDSGLIITDLHLQIKDPLPAGSEYIIKFKPSPAPAGSIMSVGTTANPAADCGAANVRCINQPDAKWTTPNSNIFDKFPLTDNDRTVDFTDPKTRNGVAGIDKGENFVDGKVYPTKPPPTLPVLVESSFSVPPAKADSKGKSVTYDAADSTLSFSNDFITKTFDPADPVLGAEVSRRHSSWREII